MNLREQGPEYGSIIRWKFDSHTWLDKPYPKEGKFAKMYQNGHVSQGFTQLQFNAHKNHVHHFQKPFTLVNLNFQRHHKND